MQGLFGAPSMLWWGAAASIPVAIHLLSRRKFRKVPWAAMHFLERAFKRTRKRLQLENILLMLLRIAILLLFACALADPRTSAAAGLGGDSSRTVFLVIDNSFSMDYRDESNEAPFDRAQEASHRLMASLDQQRDAAALLSLGGKARIHVPLTRELQTVTDSLDQIQLTHGATDTIGGLGILTGLLQEPELDKNFPGRRTIYIFTDMQRSALVGTSENNSEGNLSLDLPDPRVEDMLRQITDAKTDVYFVDVGDEKNERVSNVAVTGLSHVGKSLVKGRPTDFECTIKNFGDESVSGEIQFFVDSEQAFVQREVVTELKGRATGTQDSSERTLRFRAEFKDAGWHYVAIRYVDDALGVDNTRRFAFEVRDRIRVLAVDGNGARKPEDSAVFFLARALDPWVGRRSEGASSFDVKEVSLLEFRAENLEGYDLVVLSNVSQLSPSRVEALESFVSLGGSLLFFAGRSFEVPGRLGPSGSANALFFKSGKGLLPFRMLKAKGSDDLTADPFNLQFETFDHPAMAYFEDPRIRPGVTKVPTYKFVTTEITKKEGSRILASFRSANQKNRDSVSWPAIVDHAFGEGRVIFFSSSSDRSWNLYGATPAFVPLMKEICYALTRSQGRDNIKVGERILIRFSGNVENVQVSIGDDTPINRKTVGEKGSDSVSVTLNRINRSCLVRIKPLGGSAGASGTTRLVAVNVDPSESDLTRGGRGWITAHLGTELIKTIKAGQELNMEASGKSESRIWRAFLYCVLAFLLLETLFARQFGRESRTETQAA